LDYVNGYSIKTKPTHGIGQDGNIHNEIEKQNLSNLLDNNQRGHIKYEATTVQPAAKPFIPAYVAFDKLVMIN
jgi:hypothetical protein